MTKTDRIRELTKKHPRWTSAQIAEVVGCGDAYVRAVWQRMKGGGYSAADMNYRVKISGDPNMHPSTYRTRTDPEYRESRNARARELYRQKKRAAA